MSKKTKKQSGNYIDQNPIESIFGLGRDILGSIADDVAKPIASDFLKQVFDVNFSESAKTSGNLQEGQELDLKNLGKKQEKILADVEPGIDYRREIIHAETRTSTRNSRELQVRVEEILIEIANLTKASSELQAEFRDAVIAQPIVKAGKYHLNFFEWMLSTIKIARMRIEESTGWISAMHSKKNRKDYWSMFKKQGTTFGLSNERVVSTQTG
jgi:hypothetical protein